MTPAKKDKVSLHLTSTTWSKCWLFWPQQKRKMLCFFSRASFVLERNRCTLFATPLAPRCVGIRDGMANRPLLRDSKQRIEVSFLRNQFIEGSRFNNRAALQSNYAIVLFEQTFIQRVRNNDSRNIFQAKNCTWNLIGGFSRWPKRNGDLAVGQIATKRSLLPSLTAADGAPFVSSWGNHKYRSRKRR